VQVWVGRIQPECLVLSGQLCSLCSVCKRACYPLREASAVYLLSSFKLQHMYYWPILGTVESAVPFSVCKCSALVQYKARH
jgi:hypothetical protein